MLKLPNTEDFSLLDLPDEILLLILSFVPAETLIAFLLMSKKSYTLASDETLWKKLYAMHFPHRYRVFLILQNYTSIHNEWMTEFKKHYFASCERLYRLLINNMLKGYPYTITYKELVSLIDHYQELMRLKNGNEIIQFLKELCSSTVSMHDESIPSYYRLKLAIAFNYDENIILSLAERERLFLTEVWKGRYSRKQDGYEYNEQETRSNVCRNAIKVGDASEIKTQLQEGCSVENKVVNTFDDIFQQMQHFYPQLPIDCTLMHYAANGTSVAIVDLLLEAGADVNAKDSLGNIPLHYLMLGSQTISLQILIALLDAGANSNEPNHKGYTPFHNALKCQRADVLKILITFGAEVTLEIPEKKSILHLIAENSTHFNDVLAFIAAWIPLTACAEQTDIDSPLHIAASAGNIAGIKKWCTHEAIDSQNSTGKTPLHLSLLSGKITEEILTCMLEAKPDLTLTDDKGNTLIHMATAIENPKIMENLIEVFTTSGIPLDHPNLDGFRPLDLALKGRSTPFTCIKLLLGNHLNDDNGDTILHKLVTQVETQNLEKNLLQALNAGISPMQSNSDGHTPLHLSIVFRNSVALRFLVGACELSKSDVEELMMLAMQGEKNSEKEQTIIRILSSLSYFCCAIEVLKSTSNYMSTLFSYSAQTFSDYLRKSYEQEPLTFKRLMETHLCNETREDRLKIKLIFGVLDIFPKYIYNDDEILYICEGGRFYPLSQYPYYFILAENIMALLCSGNILQKQNPLVLNFFIRFKEYCEKLQENFLHNKIKNFVLVEFKEGSMEPKDVYHMSQFFDLEHIEKMLNYYRELCDTTKEVPHGKNIDRVFHR